MANVVQRKTKQKSQYGRTLLTLIGMVAIVVVLLLNVFSQIFMVVQYYGSSMEPGLHDRQLLVIHQTQKVDRGDVVAFYYNNKVLVRRIVAQGGTSLEIDQNGRVLLDGVLLEEPYVEEAALGQCNISFPHTVSYDEFFVMGDNRAVSMDSRLEEIGTIPRNRILGKVIISFG